MPMIRAMRLLFQPTRPHGARPTPTAISSIVSCCFNPRARTGRDVELRGPKGARGTFQPTRPHGARPRTSGPPRAARTTTFQPTRPHGARRRGTQRRRRRRRRFNPRARTGRDVVAGISADVRKCFNPRARTGRDLPSRYP